MTTPRSARRPDVRLDDGAMSSVTCGSCAARVEARKSSWEQTSIQWHGDALDACLERRASQPGPGPNATFPGCTALGLSIREAVVRGSLSVQSGEALPTHPEGSSH